MNMLQYICVWCFLPLVLQLHGSQPSVLLKDRLKKPFEH